MGRKPSNRWKDLNTTYDRPSVAELCLPLLTASKIVVRQYDKSDEFICMSKLCGLIYSIVKFVLFNISVLRSFKFT